MKKGRKNFETKQEAAEKGPHKVNDGVDDEIRGAGLPTEQIYITCMKWPQWLAIKLKQLVHYKVLPVSWGYRVAIMVAAIAVAEVNIVAATISTAIASHRSPIPRSVKC